MTQQFYWQFFSNDLSCWFFFNSNYEAVLKVLHKDFIHTFTHPLTQLFTHHLTAVAMQGIAMLNKSNYTVNVLHMDIWECGYPEKTCM